MPVGRLPFCPHVLPQSSCFTGSQETLRASLGAPTVKTPPSVRETWAQSLGREGAQGRKWQPTPALLPGVLGNPMDRGAWWATVHGTAKSQNVSDSACIQTSTHLCCRDGHSQLLISLTFPSFPQRLEPCHSLFPERTSAFCRGGPSMAEAAFVAPGALWPVRVLRLPTCLLPPGWPGPARPFWGFGAHRNQALPCLLLPGPGWLRPEVPGSRALLGVHNLTSVIWSISLFHV